MNATFHSYRDILAAHHQDSSSPENFAPIVIDYRNSNHTKDTVETNSNISSSQLSFMDESSNDFNNQQLIHSNSLIKVCGGCGGKISWALLTETIFRIPHFFIHINILLSSCFLTDKISDRYLLYALDRYWHNGCLKCHCCGAMLAEVGSSCFTRRGLILCKKDYSRYECERTLKSIMIYTLLFTFWSEELFRTQPPTLNFHKR